MAVVKSRVSGNVFEYIIHIPHRYRDGNYVLILDMYFPSTEHKDEMRYEIKAGTPQIEIFSIDANVEERYEASN